MVIQRGKHHASNAHRFSRRDDLGATHLRRLQMDSWEDKNSGQKRTKLKVVGESMQFVGGQGGQSGGGGGQQRPPQSAAPQQQQAPAQSSQPAYEEEEDDIPF